MSDDFVSATTPEYGSWPLVAFGVILTLAFAAVAVGVLMVPMEDAVLWNKGVGDLMLDLQRLLGEWGARLVTAGLFAFCAFAAGKTAYVRFRNLD